MTTEKQEELLRDLDEMLSKPELAPFIVELPSGEKGMSLESVKGLMLASMISMDDALQTKLQELREALA